MINEQDKLLSENRTHEILTARARALAQPVVSAAPDQGMLKVVEFHLARERYALEEKYVQEIHPLHSLTSLPGLPAFYLGVINVRGQIMPVIDLKKFFDLADVGITDLHVALVVRVDDVEIGILADDVRGARTLPMETLQPSLPTLSGIRTQFLKGVSAEQIVVLDTAKILKDPQLLVEDETET